MHSPSPWKTSEGKKTLLQMAQHRQIDNSSLSSTRLGKEHLTFAFEALTDQAPQHFSAVVTESGSSVRMNEESVGADLEVFEGGRSCQNSQVGK